MTRIAVCASTLVIVLAGTLNGAGLATTAPDVTLSDGSGSTLRLSDLKGTVVLLDFWASWCIPCRTSFPAMDALQRELRDRGLAVVAVNLDEQRRQADAFLEGRPYSMRVAFDPKGQIAQAFDLRAMPSTVIIDRKGQVRFTHAGYTEKTIAQYRSEVVQLLEER